MPPVGIMLPVTGTVCVRRAPEFADRIEYLAAQDPRVYRALMRFAKYGAWTGVARIASTLSIAVMVDVGAIHPDSFVAGSVADEVEIIRKEQKQHGGGGPVSNGANNAVQAPAGWAVS